MLTVHMYIGSKLSSFESSACTLCQDFVNANMAFTVSIVFKFVLSSVISTVFESKDKPTQMTKQSFTIIDFITYRNSIHFELICKDVHNQ